MSRDHRRHHHGDHADHADHGAAAGKRSRTDRLHHRKRGHGGDDAHATPARSVLAEITDRQPADAGMLLTCNVGVDDGATDGAVFTLAYTSGGAMPDGDLEVVSRRGAATTLRSPSWTMDVLPSSALVLVTIPAHRDAPAPAFHADGSVGDDHGARLED